MEEFKMRGTVKFFDKTKGWGFIKAEDNTEIFVHWSGIINMDGFKHLEEGQIVEFDIAEAKGKQAINVAVIPTEDGADNDTTEAVVKTNDEKGNK